MRALLVLLLCCCALDGHAADEAALWQALRDGQHVALVRHALAPGTFDPPEFAIGDCSTQRDLSDEGREQARALGDRFRKQGIRNVALYSSEWCRCMHTATEMRLGPVVALPALNSLHHDRADAAQQTEAVLTLIQQHRDSKPLVLVTHQVNISRLTGTHAGSGEVVVARLVDGKLIAIGRIP